MTGDRRLFSIPAVWHNNFKHIDCNARYFTHLIVLRLPGIDKIRLLRDNLGIKDLESMRPGLFLIEQECATDPPTVGARRGFTNTHVPEFHI
jgi:hypothetical protein